MSTWSVALWNHWLYLQNSVSYSLSKYCLCGPCCAMDGDSSMPLSVHIYIYKQENSVSDLDIAISGIIRTWSDSNTCAAIMVSAFKFCLMLATTILSFSCTISAQEDTCNACNCQFNNVQVLSQLIESKIATARMNESATGKYIKFELLHLIQH